MTTTDDWLCVEMQKKLDVQIGKGTFEPKYFYVWQCKRCGYRDVTTKPEPPDRPCAVCLRYPKREGGPSDG